MAVPERRRWPYDRRPHRTTGHPRAAGWLLHAQAAGEIRNEGVKGSRNLRAVQELLGHASIATTERYIAVDADEIRAAAACAW
jgi:integrase